MKPSHQFQLPIGILAALSLVATSVGADPDLDGSKQKETVLNLPMRSAGPGSLDPILGSTVYDNRAANNFYETLLQYKYLKRPYELEPLLLEEMPTTEDSKTWHFKLKKGIRFHDDACFPGGKGREMVAEDFFYSIKRFANPAFVYKSWWIIKDTIAGLDQYKDEQAALVESGEKFDYSPPVSGFRKIDDHTFEVTLTKPIYRFMWTLAMFQLSVVPHEAVETYGTGFSRHPVGTGPFLMNEEDWVTNKSMSLRRNPNYHPMYYPTEWMPEDEELGLHEAAGKRLPFADRVEITFFVQENPMWLEFNSGKLDYTQVPAENYLESFHKRSRRLKKAFSERGVVAHAVPLLDFIFRSFNMEDEILGGYTPERKKLRQAIALASDLYEFNSTFYNNQNIIYDGMVPPGLDGHPKDGRGPISWVSTDIERAKQLMIEAGYPGGEGLPVIDYYTSLSGNIPEQAELFKRQLAKIGVRLNLRLSNFAQLIEAVDKKKAAFFSFAWSSDYPDAENNLALFYGPNEAPGSNHSNYKNAEYDALYEKLQLMSPSPERTKIIETMRDMVLADTAFVGAMARTRFYVINPWLRNYKPDETFYNWVKYMDLDESKRQL
jgi:oligopeptide transport system substrate-binding protein